jgi:maltooligosyltrehalose trehalohydrolase
MNYSVSLGAIFQKDSRCSFLVWAPLADTIDVHLAAPQERRLPLLKGDRGYFHGTFEEVEPGNLYYYTIKLHTG